MEKENRNDRVSHVNVLWLIYRELSEDMDIGTIKKKSIENDTEENR